ncbi:glycoside hydrolase family 2 protein [Aestuariibaculum sediminum]|uniref:Beta-galactosidase n=1 Tax=Aestuariibaculum sediminum TaxID=2770637 RepID=A0A8J6Q9G9_9FLAO|nr:glycoside hydrolase family 2 TIM barrel-domain containing protein [Aestuariibaculum sediminum]MBD0833600.1 beta-galactosidase [Aestuariibaculum sediminum]
MIKSLHYLFFFLLIFNLQFLNAQAPVRQEIAINENWQFAKVTETETDSMVTGWQNVKLPHTWNDKDMQMGKDFYEGYAFYKKKLFADKNWSNKRTFIRFEGAGQVAELFVNGRYIGKHEGSYAAFIFDLTYDLNFGEDNTIVVRVNNKASNKIIPVNHFLFGIYGGIYRPASLIITNKTNISTTDYTSPGVYISQKNVSKEHASIHIKTKIESIEKNVQKITLETSILDTKNNLIEKEKSDLLLSPQGRKTFNQEIDIENPHLWHGKKDPYLYKVVVRIKDENGNLIDQVEQPLGIRKFEIRGGKGFYLNNEKQNMYGVCRHQDWFDYGNALSNWQHDKDLEIMNEMGVTTIRFAHYQQSEYLYSKCDSIGFIIWAEIPFVNRISGEESANAKLQMEELIKQNFNHPSIYTWGLHNEVYSKKPSDYGAVLTRDLNDMAKNIDPDRPTVSVNGYGHMDHPINRNADIQGMNRYFGWYEGHMGDIKKWVEGLQKEYPNHSVILSEYGAGANIEHQLEKAPERVGYGDDFFPEQYATRFHETQWGDIANQEYLIASYVWNMFDFGLPLWSRGGVPARNHKGLVTYDRKNKKDSYFWYKANWNKEPMVYISDRRATTRTSSITDIHVYCNSEIPILKINGKKHKKQESGKTEVHYIFKNVTLKSGKNNIEVTSGKTLKDSVIWTLK